MRLRPSMIRASELQSLLRYEKGKLFWRERTAATQPDSRARNSWNARYASREAFTATNQAGYKMGAIWDRMYFAHRVIWAIHSGDWPAHEVDHINGIRDDNRISNLRAATRLENSRNTQVRGATSAYRGVCWDSNNKAWKAQTRIGRNGIHIGLFSSEEAAARAYDERAAELFGEFARLNFPDMAIRAAMGKRTFDLGNGFSIRVIMGGEE